MDSPSAQLLAQPEESVLTFEGPPSSPFVTYCESRVASKQLDAQSHDDTLDIFATPAKSPAKLVSNPSVHDLDEDKENVPQSTQKLAFSPRKTSIPCERPFTPEEGQRKSPLQEQRRSSNDSDLMPPPSTRKTPKKTPLKTAPSTVNTRRTATTRKLSSSSFGGSLERVEGVFSTKKTASYLADTDVRDAPQNGQDSSMVDDTCFSAFSEIPDMTTFAKLTQSPTKRGDTQHTPGRRDHDATPRTSRKRPSSSRSPSPTPRRQKTPGHGDNTTTFLIDFTQQMDNITGYRKQSPFKSSTQPDLLRYMHDQRSPNKSTRASYSTPAKQNNILNLLDFELPPAPTPRSVPTITVRELESLKSSYLSQISSLKASLNGREAEVESLKRAIGDAERRVGEAQESLREEKNKREDAEQEKAGWEKRGLEVEKVLKHVKEEVMKGEVEKEELNRKMDDCERRAEDAEARAVKAEERFAEALAARASNGDGDAGAVEDQVQRLVAAQIDAKIEAVSRELHAVYKEKHERKVATLKKSYEARGEKKCADLQTRLAELEKQNEELLAAKDATFSGPVVGETTAFEIEADLKAQIEEHKAQVARLENEMQTSRDQQAQLMQELEQERIEKGDLVAAVDEMLALQSDQGNTSQASISMVEDFRKSISRPTPASGLRAPGDSKIGRGFGMGNAKTKGLGGGLRGGLERMGRTGSGQSVD